MAKIDKAPLFQLTIIRRTGSFGESETSEAAEVAKLLQAAVQVIKSGAPIDRPDQRQLKCSSGHVVGSFEFSEGMLKGPGPAFDSTDSHTIGIRSCQLTVARVTSDASSLTISKRE